MDDETLASLVDGHYEGGFDAFYSRWNYLRTCYAYGW